MAGCKIVGVLFPVNGEPRKVEFPYELEEYQKLIGGYVQALPVRRMTAWVDEDGKGKGLEYNPRAETVFRLAGGQLFPGDYLCGPVLFTGSVFGDGDDLSLPDDLIKNLLWRC